MYKIVLMSPHTLYLHKNSCPTAAVFIASQIVHLKQKSVHSCSWARRWRHFYILVSSLTTPVVVVFAFSVKKTGKNGSKRERKSVVGTSISTLPFLINFYSLAPRTVSSLSTGRAWERFSFFVYFTVLQQFQKDRHKTWNSCHVLLLYYWKLQ